MTRVRLSMLAALVAVGGAVWWVLPPARRTFTLAPDPLTVKGAIHVHTRRSDGTGTAEDVANAAARAGLDFVVLTDHGDATRFMDAPRYLAGVLMIDGVEVSTTAGHYIALGMPRAPYRLAGEPRDVIDDVRRLGGFGIVAHPDSPKAELAWRNWPTDFDAMEWLNADSQWRDEPRRALVRSVLSYWLRGPESIVALFDRPKALEQWDALTRRRAVVAVAGHDAHARMSLSGGWEPTGNERSLALPSYRTAFEAFAVRATLERPWGRTNESAPIDATALVDALRRGRVYTVIDAIAGPARLEFSAKSASGRTEMGGEVADAGRITIDATLTPDVLDTSLVLVKDGRDFQTTRGRFLSVVHSAADGPATYRIEARRDDAPGVPPVPWIVANPIYVTRGRVAALPTSPRILRELVFDDGTGQVPWRIERHAQCQGELVPNFHKRLKFTWRLADGERASQYAALVAPILGSKLRAFDQLAFRASASRPMRVSVQLRIPDGRRWRRSVYVDETPREIVVPIREMTSVGSSGRRAHLERADSLLFVVDTVNTSPGTAGETSFDSLRWQQTKDEGQRTKDEGESAGTGPGRSK